MVEKKYTPVALRRFVRDRAGGRCEYYRCHDGFSTETFELEHILPRAKGGLTIIQNLAYACSGCNGRKATRTAAPDPLTGKLVPLFHPRLDQWAEHFTWRADYTEISALTESGRATIDAL